MDDPSFSGSRIALGPLSAAINVEGVVSRLAECLAASGQTPLFTTSDDIRRLTVDPRDVLKRFLTSIRCKPLELFDADLPVDVAGNNTRVGGRLSAKRVETTQAVAKLRSMISAEVDAITFDYGAFVMPSAAAFFKAASWEKDVLAKIPSNAPIGDLRYEAKSGPASVARIISTIENVKNADFLDLFADGVTNLMETMRDADGAAYSPTQITQVGERTRRASDQTKELLAFLEDQALARARLHIAVEMLKAIADRGGLEMKAYADRIEACRTTLASSDSDALKLDASKLLGAAGHDDLTFRLNTSGFYGCLPIWLEPNAQLFESRFEDQGSFEREITYKIRANGRTYKKNGSSVSSFEARIDRLASLLLTSKGEKQSQTEVREALAQAVFLHLIFGAHQGNTVEDEARSVSAALMNEPASVLKGLLDGLRRKVTDVKALATNFIVLLRDKPKTLSDHFRRAPITVTVAIDRGIIKRPALLFEPNILRTSDKAPNELHWFEYLSTHRGARIAPHALFSFEVEYRLSEWSLTPTEPRSCSFRRNLEDPLLVIRLRPYEMPAPSVNAPREPFSSPRGVDVIYDDAIAPKLSGTAARDRLQYSLQSLALAILLHITLSELLKKIKGAEGLNAERLSALLIRLQRDKSNKNNPLYALSQGLERTLGSIVEIKLQGMLQIGDYLSNRYKMALAAALAPLPIDFFSVAKPEKIALIAYTTRPCDNQMKIVLSRSYTLTPTPEGGQIRYQGSSTRVIEDSNENGASDMLFDAIAALEAQGFAHIVLLSHDYGNRRRGRASLRHAPHAGTAMFERLAESHPTTIFYPLRRDIFPAVRLRKRAKEESAFEVANYVSHGPIQKMIGQNLLRALIPIYSFATLSVVLNDDIERPNSGVCCYFFDAVDDPGVANGMEKRELARQNILGVGVGPHVNVQTSILAMLRGLHFLESEKPFAKSDGVFLPVLDPLDWAAPNTTAAFGELRIPISRDRTGLLSLPAVLSHIGDRLNQ